MSTEKTVDRINHSRRKPSTEKIIPVKCKKRRPKKSLLEKKPLIEKITPERRLKRSLPRRSKKPLPIVDRKGLSRKIVGRNNTPLFYLVTLGLSCIPHEISFKFQSRDAMLALKYFIGAHRGDSKTMHCLTHISQYFYLPKKC